MMNKHSRLGRLFCMCCFLLSAGCTTIKQSDPARTATEELLISTAADRAASVMSMQIPKGAKVFIDPAYFDGTDIKYADGAIRASMLLQGVVLADDKKSADLAMEIRAGALSTDNTEFFIGIPSFTIPVPLAATGLTTPELALYKADEQKGVAKFSATAYNVNGQILAAPVDNTAYGFAHNTKHVLLFFISWDKNDSQPNENDLKPHQEKAQATPDNNSGNAGSVHNVSVDPKNTTSVTPQ